MPLFIFSVQMTTKLYNLEEKDGFLDAINQDEINNLNRLITNNKFETIIR